MSWAGMMVDATREAWLYEELLKDASGTATR